MRLVALTLLLGMTTPILAQSLHQDLRGGRFNEELLFTEGENVEQWISKNGDGLRLHIPPGAATKGPLVVRYRPWLRGDFTITARYDLVKVDRPRRGWGAGFELFLMLDNAHQEGIVLARIFHPLQGPQITNSLRTNDADGKRISRHYLTHPLDTGPGRGGLRLQRQGEQLIVSFSADGQEEYTELQRFEVGTAAVRSTRFGANTGGDPDAEVDLRLLSLDVDERAAGGQAAAAVEAPTTRSRRWLLGFALLVALLLGCAMALLAWVRWRRQATKDAAGEPSGVRPIHSHRK